MKHDQAMEYNKVDFFLKNHAENEAESLAPDLFVY